MRLYFLRHGIAADQHEWQGDDASRPLTPDGRKWMQREAKAMERLGIKPDHIITSPLKRAKETAEIVAQRLDLMDFVLEDERLAPGFNLERLSELLLEHRDADVLMLVGHEPDFSTTIAQLVGGANLDLKKGALARVDVADPSVRPAAGVLAWLIPPRVLAQ